MDSFKKAVRLYEYAVHWLEDIKKYEEEIGKATESIAKKSCKEAASLERQLTIEDANNI